MGYQRGVGFISSVPERKNEADYDAFARLRVSQPQTLFDGKSNINNQPLYFDDAEVSGSGTGSAWTTSNVRLSVGSAAGKRVRQSRRRLNYQPGKSQLALVTFTMRSAVTGITREVGLFDDDNGIFLRQTASGTYWCIRSGGVDTEVVEQADWGESTLDSLDLTKSQIAIIDYEWLGVGTVRVGFVIDSEIVYVHHFHHSNRTAGVYMKQPNLPVRWSLENDGTGAASVFDAICASVSSEGGAEYVGFTRTVDRSSVVLTTGSNTSIYGLVAVQLGDAGLAATVRVVDINIFRSTTGNYRWAVMLNPTVVGTALSFSALTGSGVEVAVPTNGTTFTGGTLLASGYGSGSNQVKAPVGGSTDYALGSSIAGVSDFIVLAVQNLATGAESYYGSLSFREA